MNALKTMLLALFISLLIPIQTANAQSTPVQDMEIRYQQMVLDEVNLHRQSKGLKPLTINHFMSEEARKHSLDMASKRMEFGHKDFDKRIARIYEQLQLCRAGSENIAYYKISPREVVKKWLTSPGHRRNIEGNFNVTGIGVVRNAAGWVYYTQIFVRTDAPQYQMASRH